MKDETYPLRPASLVVFEAPSERHQYRRENCSTNEVAFGLKLTSSASRGRGGCFLVSRNCQSEFLREDSDACLADEQMLPRDWHVHSDRLQSISFGERNDLL